jgi:hypothetical protein
MPASPRPWLPRRRRHCRSSGFTLVELLMVALLAAGITAAVSNSLIAMIRSGSRLELQQRAIDQWSRISFLIDSEVAEGEEILREQAFTECGGGTSLFSVRVPVAEGGPAALTLGSRTIHYLRRGNSLLRCGPPYHANGSLNSLVPSQQALVARSVRLQLVPPQADAGDPEQRRSVHYHLNILTADRQELFHPDRSSVARTRVAPIRDD